jgi:hypothetical protein
MKCPGAKMISIGRELPVAGRMVIVVCRDRRLLGYRDEKVVWREVGHPFEKLTDVIAWREMDL